MAFPTVASEAGGGETNAVTTHPITMPTGIAANDLLLAFFSVDAAATVVSGWPAGWTEVFAASNGSAHGYICRYKIAAGGDANFDLTTSTSERSGFTVYRITGWHGTTAPEAGTAGIATSSTPDPPSLSPSWGAEDTLWFSAVGIDMALNDGDVTAYPSSYTNGRQDGFSVAGGSITATARRTVNATSEDPGTFTLNGSRVHVVNTVAVRPSAGVSFDAALMSAMQYPTQKPRIELIKVVPSGYIGRQQG